MATSESGRESHGSSEGEEGAGGGGERRRKEEEGRRGVREERYACT